MSMQAVKSSRPQAQRERAERFFAREGSLETRLYAVDEEGRIVGRVDQISSSGTALSCAQTERSLRQGDMIQALTIQTGGRRLSFGRATVVRSFSSLQHGGRVACLALSFEFPRPDLIEELSDVLQSAPYISQELHRSEATPRERTTDASDNYIDKYYASPERDLFGKCDKFRGWVDDLQSRGLYQRVYRVTVMSEMNNRMVIFDPIQRRERPMVCFDSNSYLCLHDHPRVIERVQSVLAAVGYGSPSAQLLGGTTRHLRELESELSAFHGREDTIVFPTGFAANTGTIAALMRPNDALLRDRLAHASIQEACRHAQPRFNKVFKHNDMASLESLLQQAEDAGCDGKLIVTDGVFSMHGRVAPLPELVALSKRFDAKLMIDDAHGLGVVGATGSGIEEHFGMEGSVDVLMGTLSKTIGALGGYVTGSRNLISYLRFFAASGMFTTSTPAAWCAGMVEALRIIKQEPQHHQRLRRNIDRFVPALHDAGFIVPEPVSPIVTVFLGTDVLMYEFSRELFDLGVKCSSVSFPAVPKDESILRLVLTSKHTEEDLAFTVETLTKLGAKYGILHRTEEEIVQIGRRLNPRRFAANEPST